ncbi:MULTISPECIES: hypothetical protein [unclassified Halanaerobium]|uniref:hypothetical protein n=1 Tax=unclassified Halanaerobium TaxID=2641197 RepID=UPI000DF36E5A|nr:MULTISPECIES: hypothetical protein [unclassified Halanaerobium]RCW40619.1 hypothetical protein DFR78_14410 [Halanaerobium sp. MA284_MarDTE_T2]RCW87993.1 hypothetical protein DER71_10520 [Halanaerobium sp. DL-01]
MKEKKANNEALEKIAEITRKNSKKGKITIYDDFSKKPLSLSEEESNNILEEIKTDENYNDIRVLRGSAGAYLFSDDSMTIQYAKIIAQVEDKDIYKLIAERVRDDSETYPRPTKASVFLYEPYMISKEEFEEVMNNIRDKEEYNDIKTLNASNGVPYLYSSKYLEDDHAVALTEWVEVIRKEVP